MLGQIFAQRPCPIGIWRATANVAPPEVEVERVLARLEARSRVAGPPDGRFSEGKKDRADPSTGARRGYIERGHAVSVYLDPTDRGTFHGHPYVVFLNRPSDAIRAGSRRPSSGLFHRHRWRGQRENRRSPYIGERGLVSGFGTPSLNQVASTWAARSLASVPCSPCRSPGDNRDAPIAGALTSLRGAGRSCSED